ncbi:MAG: DNA ligase [Myxococcota bacterium]
MRRFEYRDAKSNKFWEIDRRGAEVTTRWGRVGTDGQSKTKDLGTEAKAISEVDKQVRGKVGKGYVEEGTAAAASGTADGDAISAVTSGDLPDGAETRVPGSGSRSYTLRNVGGVYSCSCPAWRNQSEPIERRTCKHLRRFRGDAAEQARLGSSPLRAPRRPSGAKADAPPLLLAHRWEEQDPTGWWMSEKLDGVRAYWDGARFVSRLGNAYLAPEWFREGLPDFPLDGELFAGRGAFQRSVSIARRVDAGEAWRSLKFVIFDAPGVDGGFEDRLAHLERHFEAHPHDQVQVLEHRPCTGLEQLHAELSRIEELGGEGLMLRRPRSRYEVGRSETLLKVKTFFDTEAIIVGYQDGAGRHEGRVGALHLELPDGTRFKVGTGLSDAEREAPPAVGEVITVKYQELTDAGVPRFPTYVGVRADVDWGAMVEAAKEG